MSKHYDFIAIGGGSAGFAAARTAVSLGLTTALVEGGAQIGGLCILGGCMPSKALIESANRSITLRRAQEFGLRAENISVLGDEMIARKQRFVDEFSAHRRQQLEAGGFDLIRGMAAFTGPHTLAITKLEGSELEVTGAAFLIATGSVEQTVNLPGLTETGYLGSDAVLDSRKIPKSVIVLGGGPTAIEFAHYYSGLGTRVTLIQRGDQVLKMLDVDVAGALVGAFRKRGLDVYLKTKLLRAENAEGEKRVWFEHEGVEKSAAAEEIVVALGRTPRLKDLHPERAGVVLDGTKASCGLTMQTNVSHIFAAGDVSGPHEVVHIAIQQGEVAARNAMKIVKGHSKPLEEADYRLKMAVVFSEPQIAVVGQSERELHAAGVAYNVARYPFDDLGKSLVIGETEGFVKLMVDKTSHEILGGAAIGPQASVLIHEIVAAMRFHATAGDLAALPHYHPTLSEIWAYPAEELAL